MRQLLRRPIFIVALCIGLAAAHFTRAERFVLPEKPLGRISDFARALTSEQVGKIERVLESLENKTQHQIGIVLVTSIGEDSIEDVATRLFEKWRIGSKAQNDGVLLLVAVADRKLRIEVGYGLEGVIPDAISNQIIQRDMVPALREGNLELACLRFIARVAERFQVDVGLETPRSSKARSPALSKLLILVLFVGLLMVFPFFGGLGSGGYTIGSRGMRRRHSGWGGGGWGGVWGGGGGGGGWSGGGGMSGGGGSSGSW